MIYILKYKKSLKYIKQSILANPENDIARLNYEILANNVSLNNLKLCFTSGEDSGSV